LSDGELLDAPVVRVWARLAVEALGRARAALDGVNVFPVADGDTGTNMHLTLREAAHAIHDAPDDAGGARLLRLMARGALLGARGNSGVILSEWLRGLAAAATRRDPLAPALDAAARGARGAVAHPEPGTILTAAEVAAAAAREAAADPVASGAPDGGRLAVLDAARRGAREAALASTGTLAALRAAGVLDAGACGLLLVLHALAQAQRVAGVGSEAMSEGPGTMTPVTLDIDLHAARPAGPGTPASAVVPFGAGEPASDQDELELMFVLHRPTGAAEFAPGEVAETLRADLDAVGDSVVVVGGGQDEEAADAVWQAHVHTADLEAALAVARRWAERGTVSHVHVRHLALPPTRWAAVAVTAAPLLAADLARAGALVLLDLDAPVDPDDLAQAALGAGTRQVLVLPGPVADVVERVPEALAARLAETGEPGSVEAVLLDAPGDAHLVTAVAALADALDALDGDADASLQADVPAVVRGALARLRTATTDAAGCAWVLATLLPAGAAPDVVTALTDAAVDHALVTGLAAVVAEHAPGAELVVLPTGRPGDGVTLSVETQER
jgi:hypothetical protein